jgi:transcriptional regulator with XRE-family HTH domain
MKGNNEFAISFGETIRQLRRNHKLSQEELAFRSNVDRSFISCIETGKHIPSLETADKIARGLGISLSHLILKFEAVTLDKNARCSRF